VCRAAIVAEEEPRACQDREELAQACPFEAPYGDPSSPFYRIQRCRLPLPARIDRHEASFPFEVGSQPSEILRSPLFGCIERGGVNDGIFPPRGDAKSDALRPPPDLAISRNEIPLSRLSFPRKTE